MKKILLYYKYLFLGFLLLYACARVSTPTGGPEDENPPEVLKYSIENEAKKVPIDTKEIKIEFDEYIRLKNVTNQVIISPPMEVAPTFSPLGSPQKTLTIKLNEPLKKNTTYSINFGESIEDNNEGNKLTDFIYVFSTGEAIDSLTYSGKIHDVKSLEYDEKALVGLYKVDSAFTDSTIFKQKPYYVTRPDSLGNFKFNYLHEGAYFLMGMSDGNRNLKYNPVIDKLAFKSDTILLPTDEKSNLKLFTEKDKFAVKSPSYTSWGKIIFEFLGNPDSLRVENRDKAYADQWQIPSKTRDSLVYWFKPLAKDTLKESKKDTMSFFVFHKNNAVDTLTFKKKIRFRPKKIKLALKRSENDFSTMEFTSETPLKTFKKEKIQILKDSLPIDFQILYQENNPYSLGLNFEKKYEGRYTITFLPGSVEDFFGETVDSTNYTTQTFKEQDYANLTIALENKPKSKFWLQLMQGNSIKREQYTSDSIINFKYIKPGTYKMQMIVDVNNNGSWDTGDFFKRIQPEPYLFNDEEILLNAYWDVKKTWDVTKEPITKKIAEELKTN